MEEGAHDRNDDNNGKNDEEKVAEYPYNTSPDDMEEGVSDRNDEKNEKMMREKM